MSDHGSVRIGEIVVEYSVHDFIAESQESVKHRRNNPELYGFLKDVTPLTQDDVYPKKDSYTFQEFAGPVFELGGYGDLTMVDPYTLKRLWISQSSIQGLSFFDAMRRAIDVAEAIQFLGEDPEPELQK